jgi:hypothetical protein
LARRELWPVQRGRQGGGVRPSRAQSQLTVCEPTPTPTHRQRTAQSQLTVCEPLSLRRRTATTPTSTCATGSTRSTWRCTRCSGTVSCSAARWRSSRGASRRSRTPPTSCGSSPPSSSCHGSLPSRCASGEGDLALLLLVVVISTPPWGLKSSPGWIGWGCWGAQEVAEGHRALTTHIRLFGVVWYRVMHFGRYLFKRTSRPPSGVGGFARQRARRHGRRRLCPNPNPNPNPNPAGVACAGEL